MSSTLPRPYIGTCRNRNYISNRSSSSLLFNDYYLSTLRPLKSFLPNQFKQRIYLAKTLSTNALHQRHPIKYRLSSIQLDERQFNQGNKTKSSFLFPTLTSLTDHHPSPPPPFFLREQKQITNQPINLNNSYSSSSLLNDTPVGHNNQVNHLTSTPIEPFVSSEISTTHPHNHILDRSTIPDYQLNNMSSLGIHPKTHSYDQRISDQGNKYIIQLKTDDYQEDEFTITAHYHSNQLIIDAKHNEEDHLGGFIRRELHKIFPIPTHIDLNKHTYSYNKNTQELTIEMPYLQSNLTETKLNSSLIEDSNQSLTFSYADLNLTNGGNILPPIYSPSDPQQTTTIPTNESFIASTKPFDFDVFHRSAFRPQILPTSTNENKLLMSLDLSDYQAEDIKISIQDQELIVKAERKIQTDSKKSRTSFYQSTTLPPQTDIEHLQSNYHNGKLIIEAPYLDHRTEQIGNESAKKSIHTDPYQQRTETVIEFVRLRRF